MRILVISVLLLFASLDSYAEWTRYENNFFVIYSQGKKARVEKLVRELELFRAAALQVFSIRAPADAAKTLVFIAKNNKEFRHFGASNGIVGFARREGDRTLIVMPSSGSTSRNLNTARHEYAHALLGYDSFNYPNWYEEGFAELASLIEVDEESNSFVLGLGTDRRIGSGEVSVPWNKLIEDSFSPHRLSLFDASSAYGQSWLLMHYLSLGPNVENSRALGEYVVNLKQGMTSVDAFAAAFARTPQEIWDQEMHDYSERLPYYRVKFLALTHDSAFDVSTASSEELQPLLDYLLMPVTAMKAKRRKDVQLGDFVGSWSQPQFTRQCRYPIEIRQEGNNEIAIRWEAHVNTGEKRDFVSYAMTHKAYGSVFFRQESVTGDAHNIIPEFILSYRKGDLLCVSNARGARSSCGLVYLRCNGPADRTARPKSAGK